MTATAARPTADVRRSAWLLMLTLPAFAAFLGLATVTIATQTDASAAELTPGQLRELGIAWVALHLLWVIPSLLAAFSLARIARTWRLPHAPATRLLAWVAVSLAVAYVVVQLLALEFDGDTWGESASYVLGVGLSLAIGWFGTLPTTVLVAAALARHGIARITAWSVAALAGIYLVFEVLVYLTVLFGSATLADTVGLPPSCWGSSGRHWVSVCCDHAYRPR